MTDVSGENKGPLIVGISVLHLVLSYVFVSARVVTRTLIVPQFGLDDAFIVVTVLIFTGFCVAEFVAVSYGFGRHITTLSPSDAEAALRTAVVGEFFAVFTYPTGKAAIACLLMRLFPGKTLKWVLWAFVAANAIFFYLNGIFFLIQCSPVAYQWDRSIPGGSCWDPKVLVDWGYITGSVGSATDFAFALVPWFYISKLQMSMRKKIAIGVALSAGLLPFICSILKIYYTSTLGASSDPTYSTVNLVLTGEAELCAINIAACIPTLHHLYRWCIGKNPRSSANTYPARTPGQYGYNTSSRRYGGRSKKTNSEALLTSADHDPIHTLQLRSNGGSGEELAVTPSEEGKPGHGPQTV